MRLFKIVADALLEYRRRKWSKRLAPFDAIVENVFHLRATRIHDNRPVAKRSWPKLHPALKPTNHQTRCDVPCGTLRQLRVRVTLESQAAFFQYRPDLVV